MNKYQESLHYLNHEYHQNLAALIDAKEEIEAHETYAMENEGRCAVSAVLGKVTVWVAGISTDLLELSQPVKWIAGKPVFYDNIGGIIINVTGE